MINLDAYGKTPRELLMSVAENEKKRRRQLGLTQSELAAESSVSLPSIRRFEQKGEIALSSLVKIALVLGSQEEFLSLFPSVKYKDIKDILDEENKKNRRKNR